MSHHSQTSDAGNASAEHAEYTACAERLRALGLRVTPPRLFALEALHAGDGHLTAEAVMQRIAARYPSVNLATVYRTLDTLVSAGLVTQTDLGNGVSSFELLGDAPHHHLVCSQCGAAIAVDDALLAPLRERLLRDYGFRAEAHHMAIFGLCSGCLHAHDTISTNTQEA